MTWQSGGGGASYPGVTPDGQDPPGINVAGGVNVNGALSGLNLNLVGDGTSGSQLLIGGSAGTTVLTVNGDGSVIGGDGSTFELQGDGSISGVSLSTTLAIASQGGAGAWSGGVFDTQPVLATGASNTVDDIIMLLQNYGFCKQS